MRLYTDFESLSRQFDFFLWHSRISLRGSFCASLIPVFGLSKAKHHEGVRGGGKGEGGGGREGGRY